MLGRDTKWRQGSLLTSEAAQALRLVGEESSNLHAVVITHDCDLPNEQELQVELVIAQEVAAIEPGLANARHPRVLHLPFMDNDGNELILELRHNGRRILNKASLAPLGDQAFSEFALDAASKRTFKQWLAARYARPAFPTAFECRLRKRVTKKDTVEKAIVRLLGAKHQHLAGLFVDLDDKRHVELDEGEPYPLSLQVVFYAVQGEPARLAGETIARELGQLFLDAYGKPENATEICLDRCEALPDTEMRLTDLQKVDQWRLEYLSLEADPQETFVGHGEFGL
jgi:hypothetical protein